ncbi:MAG: hypothetical protein Q7R73_01100 [bacterium]|nr:hypothetical protein [bacterium]
MKWYTWQECERDIEKIAVWAAAKNFDAVYGIPRGGLVVAVLLSHRLGIPLVLDAAGVNPKTLVVDDISDSGRTLAAFERGLAFRPSVATLFYHKDTERIPEYALNEKTAWVVFPWEQELSSRYDGTVTV